MITLTPLSASASSSSSSSEPVCYLLELDDARILLDLGQQDYRSSAQQHSWEYEENIRELAPTLSLVLLSHSPTTYLSLYPYARARWGLNCPVYATQPTVEMGRVVCLAEAESWRSECLVEEVSPSTANGDAEDHEMDGEEKSMAEAGQSKEKGKTPLRGPFVPTVEEVHEAFDWIKPIRYNQPLHLGGDLSHLLLTPFPSGHTLGGTLFKIRSPTSGTVLYAVGVNHTGERHLDGMVGGPGAGPSGYADEVLRPDLLIVEGGRSMVVNPKRRDREAALIELINHTLETSRSVLMPCDPSPRLLELLVLLDQHWSFKLTGQQRRQNGHGPSNTDVWPYPLCLVSRTAQDMVAFARSLIEWMGGVVRDSGVGAEDVVGRKGKKGGKRNRGGAAIGSEYGALDFSHVQFFNSPAELLQAFPLMQPKLVLAVPPTMSHGPSRWLFTAMASTEGNVIILTSRSEDGTLARDLYSRWETQQADGARWGQGKIGRVQAMHEPFAVEMNSKVPLVGAELEAHFEAERAQKEREAAHQAAVDRSRRMLEADDLDSDSDSESEGTPEDGIVISRAQNANAYAGDGEDVRQMSFDIFVKGQQTRVGRTGDLGGMARFRMFPFIERRGRKVDEYGEGLDIGQWVRKGREIEEEGETEEVRDAKRRRAEEEEKQKVPPEAPSKFVTEQITLDVRASLFYVDLEGLHDGQAIKTIIPDLQPRKLIVIRSSDEATSNLVSFLNSVGSFTKDVFAPGLLQEIKIGEHVASYSIVLGDSITSGLGSKWSKFEGYEVAMLNGKIAFSAGSTVPILETSAAILPPVRESKTEEPVSHEHIPSVPAPDVEGDEPFIKTEPAGEPETFLPDPTQVAEEVKPMLPLPLPSSLFVGDLRLAALKARLAAKSIPAEFAGEGVLICGPGVSLERAQGDDLKGGSIVAVRKLAEGSIVLEGSVGKVYFDVRRELYGGLAQVATA